MITIFQDKGNVLLGGFINTLIASIVALILSLILGSLMGVFQTSNRKTLIHLGNAYVEFFRNIPLLVIVMFFYVAVPSLGVKINGFWSGIIGLTLYTSSFIADIVRGGILAVPKGQFEAALSQGFSFWESMRYIIFPQAIKIVIPPLGNQFINLVKNSSILAMVAGLDLMYYGDLIASETFNTFDTYIIVGLCYLVITIPLTYAVKVIEKRLKVKS